MKKIKLLNVRVGGFASNSSSSHSCWVLPHSASKMSIKDNYWSDTEFGWEDFTLASSEAKMAYLGVALFENMKGVSPETREVIFKGLGFEQPVTDGYIDHQSSLTLPVDWKNNSIVDFEFYKALQQWVLQDNVVILGGNDNSDGHPLNDDFEKIAVQSPIFGGIGEVWSDSGIVARRDSAYNFWTIFNRDTGAKFRFSFTDEEMPTTQRASAPELVDLKITDHCPFGCKFCYMDSTQEGLHADYYELMRVIEALAEMKVFEIALGGGEPTLHPDFVRILKLIRDYGIVPNFTTKNLAWLRDPDFVRAVDQYAGGFAFSVTTADEAMKALSLAKAAGFKMNRVSLHLVMGTLHEYAFDGIVRIARTFGARVTLLGYKEVGRGKKEKPINYSWWIESVKKSGGEFNIDTALAELYSDQLKKANVPDWMYHVTEGKWSMYIDAVANKIGKSSYHPLEHNLQTNKWMITSDYAENIRNVFATF